MDPSPSFSIKVSISINILLLSCFYILVKAIPFSITIAFNSFLTSKASEIDNFTSLVGGTRKFVLCVQVLDIGCNHVAPVGSINIQVLEGNCCLVLTIPLGRGEITT